MNRLETMVFVALLESFATNLLKDPVDCEKNTKPFRHQKSNLVIFS